MIESILTVQKKNFNQFKKQLNYIYKNNKIYKEKLDSDNIKIDDIKNINDITKLPLTTKNDFFKDYPYGFYSVNKNKILRYHASSGTTGKSLIVGFTKNDLKLRNKMIIEDCKNAGIKKSDIIQICFGYGMFTGGLGFHEALEEYEYSIIPTSSGNTEKQLFYMKNLGTTVLITSPSYAMHMCEVAKEIGIDVKKLNVRIIKVGSELLTEEMRKKLRKAWGKNVVISQDYGMTETMGPGIGSECKNCNGLHIYEDNYIYELVDPNTKKPAKGNTGELVISTLHNECFPLIRYATNDIVELEFKKCSCGKTSTRIKKIIGRCDDMIKVKGVKVYLSQVEDFILSHDYCSSNYEVEIIKRKDFMDDIKIVVEYQTKIDLKFQYNIDMLRLKENELMGKFKDTFGIKAKIELVLPKTIKRYETGKVKRIKQIYYEENSISV